MYTILITESNELITSRRERIMQKSKLVDTLHFLTDITYKGRDMSSFTVLLEYVLPISKEYKSEILAQSEELYKGKLEFKLPFDTNLTNESGDIEIQISFIKTDLDADGNGVQYVRKISPTTITIVPISAWSNIIADDSLGAIDQRLIQVQAMIGALENMSQTLIDNYDNKADSLSYENNTLKLLSGKKELDSVTITGNGDGNCNCDPDGDGALKIIDF